MVAVLESCIDLFLGSFTYNKVIADNELIDRIPNCSMCGMPIEYDSAVILLKFTQSEELLHLRKPIKDGSPLGCSSYRIALIGQAALLMADSKLFGKRRRTRAIHVLCRKFSLTPRSMSKIIAKSRGMANGNSSGG